LVVVVVVVVVIFVSKVATQRKKNRWPSFQKEKGDSNYSVSSCEEGSDIAVSNPTIL
jgi:hypothetical protein